MFKLLPVQRKVVLITREPRQISVDFSLLQEAIRRKHPDHRIVVIKHKKLSVSYLGKAFREMYHLATCAGCLVDGYIIPVSILNHREELRIGQIWHALGAIKKFGHLASGTREGPHPRVAEAMRMHQNYTFVCASGSVPASIYTAAFGIPAERIKPYGMPRIDYLLDDAGQQDRRKKILHRFPQFQKAQEDGGQIILYVPTFRRGKQIPYTQLAAAFADEPGTLVLLPHPQDKSPLPEAGNTLIGTGTGVGVLDWLAVADVVITDYSAVTYEASLRNIPMVFWPYDMEDYQDARGLAVDYQAEVPGPIVSSATEAVEQALRLGGLNAEELSSAAREEMEANILRFRSRHLDFVTDDDGALPVTPPRCADQIVDALQLQS
ncbi:CDP-glycerol glycerophosphotransferase family protein [Nesterenkonia massiliensis]|uniref:CDP-glycerol glycerophosphotransferase family protein n=1 Tax=Nesterenkonia massiliensis TaxID=1232429 RepID=UPI00041F6D70|nr:CDP-glycerol glycerophosphotransferase family protein [Nesterenkonia massiliensis]